MRRGSIARLYSIGLMGHPCLTPFFIGMVTLWGSVRMGKATFLWNRASMSESMWGGIPIFSSRQRR